MTASSPLRMPLGNRGQHKHLGAADDSACGEHFDQGLEKVERCACGVARFHSKLPAGTQTEFIFGSHLLSRLILPPRATWPGAGLSKRNRRASFFSEG